MYNAIGRATDIYDTQDQMSCVMDYDMFNNMTRSYLSNQYISEYYTYDANGMRVSKLARFLPLLVAHIEMILQIISTSP